jgi:hypothetical protein
MKDYPKHVSTKQDFVNLLSMEKFKERAIEDLKKTYNLNDSKAVRATTLIDPDNPEKGYNTEIIDNPMPMWRQKGFASRQDVADLITENGGEV